MSLANPTTPEPHVLPKRRRRGPELAPVQPLLTDTVGAAHMAGVSVSTWHSLVATRRAPAGFKLGGKVVYRIKELEAWVAQGCPPVNAMAARRAVEALSDRLAGLPKKGRVTS